MPEPVVRDHVRTALRVVSPAGRSVLVLALVCYLTDALGGWPVFQLLWVACAVMGAIAVLFAVIPVRPRVSLQLSPRRTVAGEGAHVVLDVAIGGPVRLFGPLVDVPVGPTANLVRLPTLRRGKPVTERVELTALRRGALLVGPVTAHRTDPLGLIRWTERWSPTEELLVLPRTVPVEPLVGGAIRDQEGTPSDEVSMSDLAFHALREYVPGDDLRHVHWRSSAKADTLQVRQYHDTRRNHLTLVVDDDLASYGDPDDFELAVSAAASVAARADRDGADVSLLCGDHAVTGRGLDAVLDTCCRIELGDSDPASAARQAMRLAPETSWLVVLTGGRAPAQLPAALRAGLPGDVSLLVVRADATAPTSVSGADGGIRVMSLRSLEELPRAIHAAAPRVLT